MYRNNIFVPIFASVAFLAGIISAAAAQPKEVTNSAGMRLVWIEPGSFTMGFSGEPIPAAIAGRPWRADGDFDERPAHRVRISAGFYMGAFEVTNAQYEQFDPSHRTLRGKSGFSKEDNEAVVFVNWQDANRFCQWLSKKEGKPYRLPTEAEWEYAARAGTTTHFHTGDTLPEAFLKNATASRLSSARARSDRGWSERRRMPGVFTTYTATLRSGCRTGTAPTRPVSKPIRWGARLAIFA